MAFYEGIDEFQDEPLLEGSEEARRERERQLLLEQMGGGGGPVATTGQGMTEPVAAPKTANTDGYSQPGFVAENFGDAPSGWDPVKWSNPEHQTPKYVVGRILMSGDRMTPEGRAAIIANIQKAYPGTTYSGKDKVTIPGVGANIDIFEGASTGKWGPSWQPQEESTGPRPSGYYGTGDASRVGAVGASLVPDDWGSYRTMQERLMELLGGTGAFERNALLDQMRK